MNESIGGIIIRYLRALIRHSVIVAVLLLLCLLVTGDSFDYFSVGVFLPLAAFISFAIPMYAGRPAGAEVVIGSGVIIAAHFICAGLAPEKLLMMILYVLCAGLGVCFGLAVKYLGKKKKN